MKIAAAIVVGSVLALPVVSVLDAVAPEGIIIHELRYENGDMIQDRTVIGTEATFTMIYRATVARTSDPAIAICQGGDGFPYRTGHLIARMTLDEWVAEEGCKAKLQKNQNYIPCAIWSWGNESVKACGAPFSIREEQ